MSETTERVEAEPQQSTALVVVPPASLPLIVAADKDGILEALARKVAAFEPDVSTEKGRAAIRSLAYEIARSKTKLDDIGKGLTEDQRKLIDKVNAERKLVRDRLEDLQEKVRAPLTEYEETEKARVAGHEAAIATIESWAEVPADWTAAQIAARIKELGNNPLLTREWQEFQTRATKASKAAYNALLVAKVAAEDRERAAAEAAARQAEEANRQRIAGHEQALAEIEALAVFGVPAEQVPLADLHVRRAKVSDAFLGRNWEEMTDDAQTVANRVSSALDAAIARAQACAAEAQRQREAEAAERARLEAEAKAELERQEAERLAQAERDAAARREQEALEAAHRAEQQRQAAEERERQQAELAEAARIERHRSTIESLDSADRFQAGNPTAAAIQARIDQLAALTMADMEEFASEAAQTRDATLTRLRAMLAEAQEREQRQAELLDQERKRQADADALAALKRQQETERAEQEKRARNIAHRRAVNNKARDAVFAILTAEWSDPNSAPDLVLMAQRVIEGIAKGEIPAVRIEY